MEDKRRQLAETLARLGARNLARAVPAGAGGTSKSINLNEARVEAANRVVGHLRGADCTKCRNRGYIYRLDQDGYMVAVECECQARRRNARMIERSGLTDMLERCTFERWNAYAPWAAEAKRRAQRYAQHPEGWLLMSGTPGTGKSHLCTAICKELMDRGMETQYMLWKDVSTRAKALVNEDAAYQAIMRPLKRVPLLYIDDFFKSQPTVGDVNLAFELLNARQADRRLCTIISTERSIQELLDIDEALGSRIYELTKDGRILNFAGKENYRLRR